MNYNLNRNLSGENASLKMQSKGSPKSPKNAKKVGGGLENTMEGLKKVGEGSEEISMRFFFQTRDNKKLLNN